MLSYSKSTLNGEIFSISKIITDTDVIASLKVAYAKIIKKFPWVYQYSSSLIGLILDMLLSFQVIKFV
jgi:hypothetical protein